MSKPNDSAALKQESTALARVERIDLDPQALIQAAVEKGSGIETLERLVALAKDVQAQRARSAWYTAMAEFQRTCPPIQKSAAARINTRTGGSYGYTYAPLAEIMATITPVMGPLGLSVSYRVRHEKDQVIAQCRVSHEMGHHEESGEVPMPIVQESASGSGAMGANPAQRVGIASTYAKRYALLAIIGLAPVDDDSDAGDGKPSGIAQPRRASEPEQEPRSVNVWTGKILKVGEKTGTSNGKPWTLFKLQTTDGQEFGTFDEKHAAFAREAGKSPVRIEWTKTEKGNMNVVTIGPAVDEGEDA